ncbi:MAG: flagellar filament capping protein FliD [Zoogloeaceae bacterium]|jgi:flagellar hook-associated protein 2|nr:flagellar filament capping protein FliD [Zoogloeaceae bacterium]
MASVSSLGAGSGIDLESLLSKLVAAERKPKEALLTQQLASYNAKISGLGTLSSKLSALQTAAQALKPATLQSAAEKFATYTGSLDEKVGKVTVGEGAVAGSYNLKVTQLAQAQKSVSGAVLGDNPLDGTDFKIEFASGSTRTDITISGQTTLEGLRNAINAKTEESGVSATIINEGAAGKRLVLSGADGEAFTASGGGLAFNTTAAKEAKFSIDGIDITRSSNKITDVIDGVTLDLTGTTGVDGTTLSISKESETKLKSALEAFVKAYNDANSSIKSLGAYDPETKVAGALQGNSVLRDTQSALSRLVFDTGLGAGTDRQTLSSIGITVSKTGDGSLSIDADKLAAAIAKNPEGVANLTAEVGKAFDSKLNEIVGTGGRIQSNTDSLKMNVRDVEKRQEALDLRMKAVEARYRAQFTALDVLLSKMNSLSNSLASSLASLPTSYGSSN